MSGHRPLPPKNTPTTSRHFGLHGGLLEVTDFRRHLAAPPDLHTPNRPQPRYTRYAAPELLPAKNALPPCPQAGPRFQTMRGESRSDCLCGHLMPTLAGQAKVDRNVAMGIRLFLGQLVGQAAILAAVPWVSLPPDTARAVRS